MLGLSRPAPLPWALLLSAAVSGALWEHPAQGADPPPDTPRTEGTQEPQHPPDVEVLPEPPPSSHQQELRLGWTVYSVALGAARFFNQSGITLDLAPYVPLQAQGFRPAIATGFSFGHWGDDRHGPFNVHQGLAVRAGFWEPSDFLQVYLLTRAMFLLSFGREPSGELPLAGGFQPGAGLGVPLFDGYLAAELALNTTIAFDEGFWSRAEARPDYPSRIEPAALSFHFNSDLCVIGNWQWCKHSKRHFHTQVVDVSPRLLRSAAQLVAALSETEQQQLCAAVDASLDAEGQLLDTYGSAGVFFNHLLAAPLPTAIHEAVAALSREHRALTDCRDRSRWAGRMAARAEREIPRKVVYAAYPPVLRNVMGCEPEVEAQTVEITNWQVDWVCK